ncbi:MAG TPA: T9SS type A sorting domain-containing protein [bacterium]|nr:T9SS type A sorting domain-containing protein [bacterium]
MKKVALIYLVVFIITLGGQAAAQNITWHNSNLEACQILDQNNYFVAGWTNTMVFRFMKSTDAGQNWQSVEVSHPDQPFCVNGLWMIDDLVGWICGDSFGLYKTIDGGNTWTDMSNCPGIRNNSSSLLRIKFTSPEIGYILSSGDLKKTINGGNTWTTIKANQVEAGEGGFRGFDVAGETIILSAIRYNVNDLSNCYVSQDAGQTWQLSFVDRSDFSFFMKIASPSTFYASITNRRELYRSIDGGVTWSLFLNPPNGGTLTILSWTNNTLYVVSGYNGIIHILKINNGWQEVMSLGNIIVHGFDFKGNRGITCGDDGSIATFTDTTVVNSDPVTPVTPSPEVACYPNPFQGSTNVKFNQIDNSPTTVAIYNTRGQLVRALVNEQKLSPGEHIIVWDGKNNSGQPTAAGIYLYKITSGRFSSTKKMIMMK